MSAGIGRVMPGVYASLRAATLAEVTDLIVFDVDGVLVDVQESYPWVITHAVQQFLHETGLSGEEWAIGPEETALFKAAGGFNSDWDLAQGVALCYLVKAFRLGEERISVLRQRPPLLEDVTRQLVRVGGGLRGLEHILTDPLTAEEAEEVLGRWNRRRIEHLCMEYYAGPQSPEVFGVVAGTYLGPGLMTREKALMGPDLPDYFQYGIYTGRNQGETLQALKLLGLQERFPPASLISSDGGIKKPNPEGLRRLARLFRPRLMVYAGDNLDDWETASRYGADRGAELPPCLFAGILGGSPGPLAWDLFQEHGAELVADSARALLGWLKSRRALAMGQSGSTF